MLYSFAYKPSVTMNWWIATSELTLVPVTSDPAFYLTGQEQGTGNHRAFTALDPCKAEGASCTTGIDCCAGFCTAGKCEQPKTKRCAKTDESCSTSADCCDKADVCISGYCGLISVQ